MFLNKRPVYVKATRKDPATGGGSQFKIRAREATIYGRWLTNGFDYHVEVENTTGDAMCVEIARYPAAGLSYDPYTGWDTLIDVATLTVPAFGAVKTVTPMGSNLDGDTEGTFRIGACPLTGQSDSGGAAREQLCLRYGGQSVRLFLHHDRERGQDAEHLVMRDSKPPKLTADSCKSAPTISMLSARTCPGGASLRPRRVTIPANRTSMPREGIVRATLLAAALAALSSAAVEAAVLTVTNNNDSGPGSLRATVAASASR